MDKLIKTATEARQAAFAARSQTDPERYGALIGETIHGRVEEPLRRMMQVANLLEHESSEASKLLTKGANDKWEILREVRDREEKASRLKRLLPWFGLGAVALILAMTVTLPRFSAINGATCAVFGGEWVSTRSSGYACVHYRN